MSKPIILSGPGASGKTWTCIGIANFFPDHEVKRLDAYRRDIKRTDLTYTRLCIVDGCLNLTYIKSFDKVRERFPYCNFVFTTLMDLNRVQAEGFHLINCQPLYDDLPF